MVADGDNFRISVFDGESGSFVRTFGSGDGTNEDLLQKDGQLFFPSAITADAHDHLLVLDLTERYNKVIQEEFKSTEDEFAVKQVGKVDAKKRLETDADDVMTDNILQAHPLLFLWACLTR